MSCTVCPKKSRLGQKNGNAGGIKAGQLILPITILGSLWLANKLFGKKKPPPPEELPDAGSGIPENWSPRPLTQELYDTMKGVIWYPNMAIRRDGALLRLIGLASADMFVAVYNDFTQNFGEGDTLREWIDDEYLIPSTIKTQLNILFNSLGLSGKGMKGWLTTPGIDPARQFFNWNMYTWPQQYKKVVQELNTDLDMIARS